MARAKILVIKETENKIKKILKKSAIYWTRPKGFIDFKEN
jgi:hypothetical protein